MTVDRSELSRSLNKIIAYTNVNKTKEANQWALVLVEQLKVIGALK